MYEMGDLTRAEYQKKRDCYQAQLAALRPPDFPDFEEIAELMADFPGTWKEATPKERKEILYTFLSEVRLDREKGVAIKVNPEMEMLFLPLHQWSRPEFASGPCFSTDTDRFLVNGRFSRLPLPRGRSPALPAPRRRGTRPIPDPGGLGRDLPGCSGQAH